MDARLVGLADSPWYERVNRDFFDEEPAFKLPAAWQPRGGVEWNPRSMFETPTYKGKAEPDDDDTRSYCGCCWRAVKGRAHICAPCQILCKLEGVLCLVNDNPVLTECVSCGHGIRWRQLVYIVFGWKIRCADCAGEVIPTGVWDLLEYEDV